MKSELKVEMLVVAELLPDPQNPRSSACDQADRELAESIRLHNVKVPILCYRTEAGIMIGDGHRRWRCSQAAGKELVPGIVLPRRPEEVELLTVQLTINAHRQNLNPVEEFEAFERLAKLKGWSPSQLAAGLAVSAAEVTRVLSLGKLSAEERQLVREGKVPKSSGYALARIHPDERHGLAAKVVSGEVTRDQLDAMARRKGSGDQAAGKRVSCRLPQGTVTVTSEAGLNLSSLIDLLENLVRSCRRLRAQKLDISTAMRVLRDQVEAAAASPGALP